MKNNTKKLIRVFYRRGKETGIYGTPRYPTMSEAMASIPPYLDFISIVDTEVTLATDTVSLFREKETKASAEDLKIMNRCMKLAKKAVRSEERMEEREEL